MYSLDQLAAFQPAHDTLVGIDSDGCVFDTMEAKQKVCFHPIIIRFWKLEPIAPAVRETAEFVNLYSTNRGSNRFIALVRFFEMLARRPEVKASGLRLPDFPMLSALIKSGVKLSHETLAQEKHPELDTVLTWSRQVNEAILKKLPRIQPFPGVVTALRTMKNTSDLVVVSQTPEAALIKEWDENDLHQYVSFIAGQELGTKTEHLQHMIKDTLNSTRTIMIGDAPGDLKAAREVQACFYPILPGHEAESWKRWNEEAYPRFLEGAYQGSYEEERIQSFNNLLPDTPPWPLDPLE